MDSIERKYYDEFEHGLLRDMLRLCTSAGMLDGNLLQSEDIDCRGCIGIHPRIPGDKGFGRNNVFMRTYGYGQDPSRTGGIAD